VGSRFFLFRQGVEPKGIVGCGYTTGLPTPSEEPGEFSNYCPIALTAALNADAGEVLALARLSKDRVLGEMHWNNMPGSGVALSERCAVRLEELWAALLKRLKKAELSRK